MFPVAGDGLKKGARSWVCVNVERAECDACEMVLMRSVNLMADNVGHPWDPFCSTVTSTVHVHSFLPRISARTIEVNI